MFIRKHSYQLDEGIVIAMDGAMGTELYNRGVALDPHTWSAEALATEAGQNVIVGIHADSIAAGAKIIITNTFRTDWLEEGAGAAALLACQLAHRAVAESKAYDVAIAGSIGPVGDCYDPNATPSDDVLRKHHTEQIGWLQQGGVDFILAETMPTVREAVIVAEAAADAGLSVSISFCCRHKDGTHLLSGESLSDAVQAVTANPQVTLVFLGVNCVSPRTATQAVEHLRSLSIKGNPPISVYAQGIDESSPIRDDDIIDPFEHYLVQVDRWLDAGVRVIGGCCGVPPSWIESIAQKIECKNEEILQPTTLDRIFIEHPVYQ
jgi:S-methylmethionine-dependent homocysteine/selenocysteine methylase